MKLVTFLRRKTSLWSLTLVINYPWVLLMQCWSRRGANEGLYGQWRLHPKFASGHIDKRGPLLLLTVLSQRTDKCSTLGNPVAFIWFSILAIITYYPTQLLLYLWGPLFSARVAPVIFSFCTRLKYQDHVSLNPPSRTIKLSIILRISYNYN